MTTADAPSIRPNTMAPKRARGNRPTRDSPPAAETSDLSTTRKSEQQADAEDENVKGARRGRPRVEQQDESAAERRRTQIRLAQRAYRERKETTIAELEKKVALLQGHLQQMRQAVGDFQHLAIDAGLESWHPALAQSLRETVFTVRSLADENEPPSDALEAPSNPSSKRVKTGRKRSHSPEPAMEAADADFATYQQDWLPTMPLPDMTSEPWGYAFDLDDLEQNHSSTVMNVTSTTNAWLNDIDPATFPAKEHAVFTESWTTPLHRELKPIRTSDVAERSFARRWNRYCYENTYNMLTNPRTPPDLIHRVLRYSLCFGSVRMIAQRIKYKLMRPANEPLEVWELPVLHVGGSGQHFPDRAAVDDSRPPPQGFAAETNMGPWQMPRKTRAPADVYPYQVAQWLGIEGVWFDAYDVEQYLRTKGLLLDGTSAVAKLELDEYGQPVPAGDPGLTSSPSDGTSLTYSTPRSPTSPGADGIASEGAAAGADADIFAHASVEQVLQNMTPDLDFALDATTASAMDMDLDFPIYASLPGDKADDLNMFPPLGPLGPLEGIGGMDSAVMLGADMLAAPHQQQQQPKKKREVVIDVEKLIRALHNEAICLGRSPGIKRDDVDKVFQKVVRESFEIS